MSMIDFGRISFSLSRAGFCDGMFKVFGSQLSDFYNPETGCGYTVLDFRTGELYLVEDLKKMYEATT